MNFSSSHGTSASLASRCSRERATRREKWHQSGGGERAGRVMRARRQHMRAGLDQLPAHGKDALPAGRRARLDDQQCVGGQLPEPVGELRQRRRRDLVQHIGAGDQFGRLEIGKVDGDVAGQPGDPGGDRIGCKRLRRPCAPRRLLRAAPPVRGRARDRRWPTAPCRGRRRHRARSSAHSRAGRRPARRGWRARRHRSPAAASPDRL